MIKFLVFLHNGDNVQVVRHRSRDGRDAGVEPAEDVYAALSAISRVAPASTVVLNLRGADLRKADLRFMCGIQVHLGGADLADAKLPDDWNVSARLRDQQARTAPGSGSPAVTGPEAS